jgi:hypothetical protein
MKFIDNYHIGKESIDFQNGIFGKELEAVIKTIQDDRIKTSDLQSSDQRKLLQAIILKHTGLNINLLLNTDQVACVYLPTVHRNHLFYYNEYRHLYEMKDSMEIFKKIKEIKQKNTVNLKTSTVTGIFSKLEVDIHLEVNSFLRNGMPPGQITAILLHEVGHLFTYYEYITRQHSTNQILAGIFRSVLNKDSIKEREFVFEQAGVLLGGDKNTFKDLVNQNDTRVISTVVYSKHVEFMKSELGSDAYDYTACEQLADQFATRHGYGRELIEALETLGYMFGSTTGKISEFWSGLFQIVSFILMTTVAVFALMVGNVLAFICFGFLPLVSVLVAGSGNKDYTYDILKTRYLRVREQMIQRLKDKRIKKEESELIVDSIKRIDVVISETYEERLPLDKMMDFIFSSDKKVRSSVVLHRQLEELASNDLFIKSAELSLI